MLSLCLLLSLLVLRIGQAIDSPLSEIGLQQAEAAGRYLKDVKFSNVFVSDMLRAQQVLYLYSRSMNLNMKHCRTYSILYFTVYLIVIEIHYTVHMKLYISQRLQQTAIFIINLLIIFMINWLIFLVFSINACILPMFVTVIFFFCSCLWVFRKAPPE